MNHVLEFDSLNLEFGLQKVLTSVYMKCSVGEVVGLLGRNGSGKSCLMKIVSGAMQAEQKSIRINGVSIGEDFVKRRLISYLPQTHLIPSYVSIGEALSLFDISIQTIKKLLPDVEAYIEFKPHDYRVVIAGLLKR